MKIQLCYTTLVSQTTETLLSVESKQNISICFVVIKSITQMVQLFLFLSVIWDLTG